MPPRRTFVCECYGRKTRLLDAISCSSTRPNICSYKVLKILHFVCCWFCYSIIYSVSVKLFLSVLESLSGNSKLKTPFPILIKVVSITTGFSKAIVRLFRSLHNIIYKYKGRVLSEFLGQFTPAFSIVCNYLSYSEESKQHLSPREFL